MSDPGKDTEHAGSRENQLPQGPGSLLVPAAQPTELQSDHGQVTDSRPGGPVSVAYTLPTSQGQ